MTECDSKKAYAAWYATKGLLYSPQGWVWTVKLDMIFNQNVNVVANYMTHTFTPAGSSSPNILSAQDVRPRSPGPYGPDDEYEDTITWSLPSTNKGSYKMQIVVHGPSKDSDNYVCLLGETIVN